jgi:H+/Cl- antiporter ClcA
MLSKVKLNAKQCRSYWYLDLLGMIISGLVIGYEAQIIADSGGFNQDDIIQSMFASSIAYLIGFLIFSVFVNTTRFWHIPRWILMAITGSIFCFLSLHVIKFAFDNWQYKEFNSISNSQYFLMVLGNLIQGIIIISPIYSFIAVLIMGTLRLPLLLNLKREV